MSPRPVFEQELKILKNQVAEMCDRAQISYDRLLLAINTNDRDALEQLLDNDRHMTDMQRGIEAKCLTLLTKQQPVARDLRLVTSALKVVTDIERIGDHVTDIAELCLRTEASPAVAYGGECMKNMMSEAKKMLIEAVEAFTSSDMTTAKAVINKDDDVDRLFNQVKDSMMQAIRERSLDADVVVDTLMLAKYLEKIGDHAVNIAEWAIFMLTGDIQGVKLY
ncbi:MAG: phosphate signaling complex protein PhoU [Lachnospiraceae bacterium]|nr:phosphate signaling complex protein PhoU [Lachnospiraceae bacterium]